MKKLTALLLLLPVLAIVYSANGFTKEPKVFVPVYAYLNTTVQLKLIPDNPQRKDRLVRRAHSGRDDLHILTGPIWSQVFIGTDQSAGSFTIDSTRMTQQGSLSGLFIYDVEAHVECHGRTFPVKASGKRSANLRTKKAMTEAVERAVLDAANQSLSILQVCRGMAIDIPEQLIRLDELRQKGILTNEEFEKQKRKLLEAN